MSILSDIDIIVEMKRYLHGIDLNLKKMLSFLYIFWLFLFCIWLTTADAIANAESTRVKVLTGWMVVSYLCASLYLLARVGLALVGDYN